MSQQLWMSHLTRKKRSFDVFFQTENVEHSCHLQMTNSSFQQFKSALFGEKMDFHNLREDHLRLKVC